MGGRVPRGEPKKSTPGLRARLRNQTRPPRSHGPPRHDHDHHQYETSSGIIAWLGPIWDDAELTPEQLDRFTRAWDDVAERYGEDEQREATAALTGAVRYLLGELDVWDAGRDLLSARAALAEATATARQVAIMAADDGATDVDLARDLGIDRARTIRRWLGKS